VGLFDRVLDSLLRVIRMNDKVEGLSAAAKSQQAKIEDLTARVIRLETALEIALVSQGKRLPAPKKKS
jgi:hypothetical protein